MRSESPSFWRPCPSASDAPPIIPLKISALPSGRPLSSGRMSSRRRIPGIKTLLRRLSLRVLCRSSCWAEQPRVMSASFYRACGRRLMLGPPGWPSDGMSGPRNSHGGWRVLCKRLSTKALASMWRWLRSESGDSCFMAKPGCRARVAACAPQWLDVTRAGGAGARCRLFRPALF